MPRHDVAIYMPAAATYYDAAPDVATGGGAERQTFLLAHALAESGLRVAHIVYPVVQPRLPGGLPLHLVQRPRPTSFGSAGALARELRTIWRALDAADASVVVIRGAQGGVGLAALWGRRRGRRVVFAGANDSDFQGTGPFAGRADPRGLLFRTGRARVAAVVAQSEAQADLARATRRHGEGVHRIASFVEPAAVADRPGEAFLWVSRLAEYKQPMRYLDLAAALPEARFWMVATGVTDDASRATLATVEQRAAELPNLELLPQRPHAELQELIARAVAMVNTSSFEGMPNTWLEGWARGIPALTLEFDPDERIARDGLGVAAGGSWDAFVAGARRLWEDRDDRRELGEHVRAHVQRVHGADVAAAWRSLLTGLAADSGATGVPPRL